MKKLICLAFLLPTLALAQWQPGDDPTSTQLRKLYNHCPSEYGTGPEYETLKIVKIKNCAVFNHDVRINDLENDQSWKVVDANGTKVGDVLTLDSSGAEILITPLTGLPVHMEIKGDGSFDTSTVYFDAYDCLGNAYTTHSPFLGTREGVFNPLTLLTENIIYAAEGSTLGVDMLSYAWYDGSDCADVEWTVGDVYALEEIATFVPPFTIQQ